MKSVYRYVGLMVSLMFLSFNSVAQDLFDTAAGATTSGNVGLSDDFWPSHRFEVTSTTTLGNVGGVFRNTTSGTVDVFAAIVSLTGSTDLPDSTDLTTSDVIGTTLVSIAPTGSTPGEFEGTINLELTPSFYAIVFGTGAFGADSTSFGLAMPSLVTDLAPTQAVITLRQLSPAGFITLSPTARFFGSVATVLSCVGFERPMDGGAVKVKKNRALPHKAQLFDGSTPINDLNITAPPVIQVIFKVGTPAATDVTGDAVPAGAGTDGNQFEFLDSKWHFNLKTKNYTAPGAYTTTMESGDDGEYLVDPTCTGLFVIK